MSVVLTEFLKWRDCRHKANGAGSGWFQPLSGLRLRAMLRLMKSLGLAVLLLLFALPAAARDELVTSARTPGGETIP